MHPLKVKRKVLYTKAFRICKKLQKYEGKDQATIDKEMEDFHPTETLKELSIVKPKHFGFVIPDDKRIMQDIFIPKGQSLGAVDGHKVLVQITKYADGTDNPEGHISAILGHKMTQE